MQSASYIEVMEALPPKSKFGLPVGSWFIDAGVTADGRCWVAPSEDFYEEWLSDDRLRKCLETLGFDWSPNGFAVGSRSPFIFYCPFGAGRDL